MRLLRRTARWCAVMTVATIVAGCSSDGDRLDAGDGSTTTRARRFPGAVVSTTTPSTTPFGQVVRGGTTSTTRRSSTGTSAATTSTSVAGGPTKPAETPLPVARTGVAGAAWQGLVIVAGGTGAGGGPSVRVDAFDPKTGQWSRGPNLPVALHDAALAVLGEDLWVIGGFAVEGDQPVAQSATYFFHPGDTAWQNGPALHTARGGAAAATLGSFLVVLGGQTTDGGILDTVEFLSAGAGLWKDTAPLAQGRAFASALAMNGRIYAVGGRTAAVSATDAVESWRGGATSWRTESRLDKTRASAAGAASCVAGGENGEGIVATIECYGTGFWVVQGQMRVPRHGLAAVFFDGWLHLVGGSTAGGTVTNAHEVVALS
jgi:hypothetical protein